jgi:cystathionine beta-lyase family protein involved in aluminum resistance
MGQKPLDHPFNDRLKKVSDFVVALNTDLKSIFSSYEDISFYNQAKVLAAFKAEKISTNHFNPSTGYGYSDQGREKLCSLFARVFKAQAALVSPHILSGTHAIFLALCALLSKDDMLLSVTGKPYDTLATAIGISGDYKNSLTDRGVVYKQISLEDNGTVDFEAIATFLIDEKPKVVYIQRSRGYAFRKSVDIDTIKKIVSVVKKHSGDSLIVCDNCYGEFCEKVEPLEVGVDMIIGSLIKNPGGGIAPNGGYIAGKKTLIKTVEYHFTAPGIGHEVGSYSAGYLPFFQGLFLAPKVVEGSIKGAILTSYVMQKLGFNVLPKHADKRTDITQSIKFDTKEELIKFIQGIQMGSPVESYALPTPWDMPGYDSAVIMAAGTFIQGASIELSADAPIKAPYVAYIQGGLTYEYHMLGLIHAIDHMDIL